jgi:hypothetical protein
VCCELIRNISLSSVHNIHGNYSQWSRHLIHSWDSEFRVSSVHVAFMVGRVAVGQVFSLHTSVFPLSTPSHQCSILSLIHLSPTIHNIINWQHYSIAYLQWINMN